MAPLITAEIGFPLMAPTFTPIVADVGRPELPMPASPAVAAAWPRGPPPD